MKKTAVWVIHISVQAKIGVFPRMLSILRKDDMAKFPSYIIENEKHPCFYGTLVPNFPTPSQLEPNEIGEIEPNLFTAVIILSHTIRHIIPWGWTVHKHQKTEQEVLQKAPCFTLLSKNSSQGIQQSPNWPELGGTK